MIDRPKIGVGVIIMRDGMVIMQKRRNAHGNGTWSFPGGHLEYGESFEDCARREVIEEVGCRIRNVRIGPTTNDLFEQEQKHYITIFAIAEYDSGDVRIMEPDRIEECRWVDWDDMPSPLFLPVENLRKTNFRPYDPNV